MSRRDLRPAYTCGTYHRRGRAGCTSHHIRADKLDEVLKAYIRKIKENSAAMLERLNADLAREAEDVGETERSAANLEEVLADLQEELKATKRQRVRDLMKHPDQEELLEETYDELEQDLLRRMEGIQNQLRLAEDKRNTIIQVNRVARTALEVFDSILEKEHLDRNDLQLMIEKIRVYEDHLEVRLKGNVDSLLRCGVLPEEAESPEKELAVAVMAAPGEDTGNFKPGMEDIAPVTIVQTSPKRRDKVFHANVISDGDPLEIFTDNDGEVIFKKYSPIGELGNFASAYSEVLYKTGGYPVVICDRDHVVAAAGISKKEILERRVSPSLEDMIENRKSYAYTGTEKKLQPVEGVEHYALVQYPIIASGDVCGSVMYLMTGAGDTAGDSETKLIGAAAAFLGKQMEE